MIELLHSSGALEFGNFVLSSGRESDYYIDAKKLLFSSHVLKVAMQVCMRLEGIEFEAIGGPALAAVPLVGAMLTAYANKRGFAVRSEEKQHGKSGVIVGSVLPGDRVVLVEDVVTSGQSLLRAVDKITKFGCQVVSTIAIVDRTGEMLQKGIPFTALVSAKELNDYVNLYRRKNYEMESQRRQDVGNQ